MMRWPTAPSIYEINTAVWLRGLSGRYGRHVDLGSVPDEVWDAVALPGLDAVWLMGVWERSPAGVWIALQNVNLKKAFREALPDFSAGDNIGSPYCIRQYRVDARLGGDAGLAEARRQLADRGLRLILDFVPNHVAPDHPWVGDAPDFFIRGTRDDVSRDPVSFMEIRGSVFANGRDPYYPAWPDVLQLNAFSPALRGAACSTLLEIAKQCDGVRCDMAMLFLNDIFARTWGDRAGDCPDTEYWEELIPMVKAAHPAFLCIAEAYWDTEWRLQQLGFDFCYDKRLYDRMAHENAETIRLHLIADRAYQDRLLRFIENHDEPRAADRFPAPRDRAAAIAVALLPGAKLYHEGQFEGRRVRLPVFLVRRPEEWTNPVLTDFYRALLARGAALRQADGSWSLCEALGWPDNGSARNLLAWTWRRSDERTIVVVNYAETSSQGRIQLGWEDLEGRIWHLTEAFSGETFDRDGDAVAQDGLFVDLPPWGWHIFTVAFRKKPRSRAASSKAAGKGMAPAPKANRGRRPD